MAKVLVIEGRESVLSSSKFCKGSSAGREISRVGGSVGRLVGRDIIIALFINVEEEEEQGVNE